MIKKFLMMFIFLCVSENSFANTQTLKKTNLMTNWIELDKDNYEEILLKYSLNDSLGYELYGYINKDIGYLREFLPFNTYKNDTNGYVCISKSVDRIFPSLKKENLSLGTVVVAEPSVYILSTADTPEHCYSEYHKQRYARLYGQLDIADIKSLYHLLSDNTALQICDIDLNRKSFLDALDQPFDIDVKVNKAEKITGTISYRISKDKSSHMVEFERNESNNFLQKKSKNLKLKKCLKVLN